MSKISDKMRINTADAAPRHNHPAIFSDHFTTQCFLRPSPILCLESTPKRKTVIKAESFARFKAMPRAVFGRANVYNRCFFVPYRTVFRQFNPMITGSPTSTGNSAVPVSVVPGAPLITDSEIVDLVNAFALPASGSVYDYTYQGTNMVLDNNGVYVHKVLRSLGYPFKPNNINDYYSSLPLLCFIKVHLDWYYPSQFAYSSIYAYFENYFENNNTSGSLDLNMLIDFFRLCAYCQYNQDYFTSSWTNPVGPTSLAVGSDQQIGIIDISNSYPFSTSGSSGANSVNSVGVDNTSNSNGTPSVNSVFTTSSGATQSATPYRLNQYIIDALRSLTDYTVRHRLSGIRMVDRYLAEFGINLSSEISKRSIYLGYSEFPCQFGDNMSTADTSGARLGDYSGKGIAYDRGNFTIDGFEEFGMIIIVNSVVPQVGYYQGYDRHVKHILPLDFYRGDFDHLGVQPIPLSEVYNDPLASSQSPVVSDSLNIFAFVPRYGEYLVYNDHVTGLPSLNTYKSEYDGMMMQRDLDSYFTNRANGSLPLTQSYEFVMAQDYQQFNRLFYSTGQADNIDFIHHFTIEFTDSMKDLFETYDFEKHLNSVTMNVNGSNLQ